MTDIQKYSIHDGSGIRTAIFFKGCPLSCKWCHNPETQSYKKELYFYSERCTGCGACAAVCEEHAVLVDESTAGRPICHTDRMKCRCTGKCTDVCVHNAREICGKNYSIPQLIQEIVKDRAFYETSDGGVTLSGGEVLSQNMDMIEMLAGQLAALGISVYIDTCGHVPYQHIERVLPYTDVFLYDLKLMDNQAHLKYTGVTNHQIKENLIRLSRDGGKIWIRIPVVGTVNDTKENITDIAFFLKEHDIQPEQIHLLPYHAIGKDKYNRLGKKYGECFTVPEQSRLDTLMGIFYDAGYGNVYIGG